MAAYMRFSMTLRRSLMPAICSSSSFWVAASAARRAAASARSASSAASCASTAARPDDLDEHSAPVLELHDGGVEILDGEQARKVVGHAIAS